MQKTTRKTNHRDGAIIPLFAMLLPVLLVLAAFSVNLARMQLTTTELRIATDVTSHAGGRALNVYQNMDQPNANTVIDKLQATVDRYYVLNTVAGQTLTPPSDPSSYIQFYNLGVRKDRLDDTFYQQNKITESQARGGEPFNGVGVLANVDTDHVFDFKFGGGSLGSFAPTRNSITKQVERDLAIVIDKSGSMLEYKASDQLTEVLTEMRNQNYITPTEFRIAEGYQRGDMSRNGTRYFTDRGRSLIYHRRFRVNQPHWQRINGSWQRQDDGFNIIDALEQFGNDNPGDDRDIPAMIDYAKSWEGVSPYVGNRKPSFHSNTWTNSGMFNDHAPSESRWDYLYRGIQDFIEVLENTPAEERISLVVFDSTADAPVPLTSNYQGVLDEVESIIPYGGTGIDKGMREGLERVLEEDASRPFTEKIIVVMTDGQNNDGGNVVIQEAREVKNEHPEITVHTLTFGEGTGLTLNPNFPGQGETKWDGVMAEVAKVGGGEHFHAEEADELQQKLKEIANIQPTIFTY